MLRFVPWMIIVLVAGGCASTYDTRYAFEPRPAAVELRERETENTVARTLVSIVGVRRHATEQIRRPGVDTRLRIENVGDVPIELDPGSLNLLSADLSQFDPPIIHGEGEPVIPPDSFKTFTAIFPFPPAAEHRPFDLDTLTLQWTLLRKDDRIDQEQTFRRQRYRYERRYYYRPYWYYYDPFWPSGRYHFGFRYRW